MDSRAEEAWPKRSDGAASPLAIPPGLEVAYISGICARAQALVLERVAQRLGESGCRRRHLFHGFAV